MMTNTLDVTVSGYLSDELQYPNCRWFPFKHNDFRCYFQPYTHKNMFTLNLAQVETFHETNAPVLDKVVFHEKQMSKLKKWWFSDWCPEKIYDVEYHVKEIRAFTFVKMRSGTTFLVDESVECLKNALDGCIWTHAFIEAL